MLLHDTGIIGKDLFLDPNQPPDLRVPSTANITYPACEGNPPGKDDHANGQLLGRLWWNIRTDIHAIPSVALSMAQELFADWTMLTSGSADPHASCSSYVQPADADTLIEVLTADDDDSDLSNGTPNRTVICQAFSDRGVESPPGLGLCTESAGGTA